MLLDAPDVTTAQGRRDHMVLLFLYNTGSRADEAVHVAIGDLHLPQTPSRDPGWVLIHGKGNKERRCPLWERTVAGLIPLVGGRAPSEHTFLNRCGRPLTRFGVHALVGGVTRLARRSGCHHCAVSGSARTRSGIPRQRTCCAAGVDINTIRAWLGHVSLATTNVYAEVDLQMKANALAACEVKAPRHPKPWRENANLMEFLGTL